MSGASRPLVVDDVRENVRLLERAPTARGYEVVGQRMAAPLGIT